MMLLRSEIRRRRRVLAGLLGVFILATGGLSILIGAIDGFEEAVGGHLRTTLSGDHRVGESGFERLGEGAFFPHASARAGALASALSGTDVAPRIEFKGLFLASDAYEDFHAGLIVGYVPTRDPFAPDLADALVSGRLPDGEHVWIDGVPHPQLLVGERLMARLGLSVHEEGTDASASLLNVTAGRFSAQEGAARPVVKQGVVVGVFRTGFGPLDESTTFVHIETARALLRKQFDDEANVLIVAGAPGRFMAEEAAASVGMRSQDAAAFRESYLENVFLPLQAFVRIVMGVVLLLAGGWVAHVVVSAVHAERERLAVLRAIGAGTHLLAAPLAVLVVLSAIVGGFIGLGVGAATGRVLAFIGVRAPGHEHLELVAHVGFGESILLVLLVTATAGLAASAAFRAVQRVPITEALRL